MPGTVVWPARRIVSESNDKTPASVSEGVVDLALHKRVALSLPEPDLQRISCAYQKVTQVSPLKKQSLLKGVKFNYSAIHPPCGNVLLRLLLRVVRLSLGSGLQ